MRKLPLRLRRALLTVSPRALALTLSLLVSSVLLSGCGVAVIGAVAAFLVVSEDDKSDPVDQLPTAIISGQDFYEGSPDTIEIRYRVTNDDAGSLKVTMDVELEDKESGELAFRRATPTLESPPTTDLPKGDPVSFLWDVAQDVESGDPVMVRVKVTPFEDGVPGIPETSEFFRAGNSAVTLQDVVLVSGKDRIFVFFNLLDEERDMVTIDGNADDCNADFVRAEFAFDRNFSPCDEESGCSLRKITETAPIEFAASPTGFLGSFNVLTSELADAFPQLEGITAPGFVGTVAVRLLMRDFDVEDFACAEGDFLFDNNRGPTVEILPIELPVPSSGILPLRYRLFDADRQDENGPDGTQDGDGPDDHLAEIDVEFTAFDDAGFQCAHEFPHTTSEGRTGLPTLADNRSDDLDAPVRVFLWDARSQLAEAPGGVGLRITARQDNAKDEDESRSQQRTGPLSFSGLLPLEELQLPVEEPQGACNTEGCLRALVSGDFNQDSFADVVLMERRKLRYFRGTRRGLEPEAFTVIAVNGATDLAMGDLDGDSFTDLVVANSLSGNVKFVFGGERGLEDTRECNVAGTAPQAVEVGDFDGDGCLDVAVATALENARVIYLPVSRTACDGRMSLCENELPLSEVALGAFAPLALASGDFNGDERSDLVVALDPGSALNGKVVYLPGGSEGLSNKRRTDIRVGAKPTALSAGKFDVDEFLDVVVANEDSNSVSFLRGGPRGLLPSRTIAVGDGPRALTRGDYDADGHLDLAVANSRSDQVTVLWGGMEGPSTDRSLTISVGDPYAVISTDLDADGFLDIVVALRAPDKFVVLHGGREGISAQRTFGPVQAPEALTSGDYDGNGVPDLALAGSGSGTLTFALGMLGGPVDPVSLPTGDSPVAVTSGDYNGDGFSDAVVATGGLAAVTYLRGGERGLSTERRQDVPLACESREAASGDLDQDGFSDVLLLNRDRETDCQQVSILFGGTDGLSEKTPPLPVEEPSTLTTGDFDGDGILEVVVGRLQDPQGELIYVGEIQQDEGFEPDVSNRIPLEFPPTQFFSGDVNGDGLPDLVVLGSQVATGGKKFLGKVFYLRGSPGGLSPNVTTIAVGDLPVDLTGGDYDGDGFLDIVVAAQDSARVDVLRGGADGLSDGRKDRVEIAGAPVAAASGDYDSDGFQDVVVAFHVQGTGGAAPGRVVLLRGSPDGLPEVTDEADTQYVGDEPSAIISGDLNADGFLDIVVANEASETVTFLRGSPEGLHWTRRLPVGAMPCALSSADYDGDGFSDIVVANNGSANVTYLRQRVLTPHANAFFAGSGSDSDDCAESTDATPPLLDPRHPAGYRLDISGAPFSVATQVAILPAPLFSLDERRCRPVTGAVRLLPEGVAIGPSATLTLRLLDHDEDLFEMARQHPERLRVFLHMPGEVAGTPVDAEIEPSDFEGGMGVAFPIVRSGCYLVALEDES